MENGHPGVEVDEAAIRKGENPYTKYYQQQGEQPVPSNGQVSVVLAHSERTLRLTGATAGSTTTNTIPVKVISPCLPMS